MTRAEEIRRVAKMFANKMDEVPHFQLTENKINCAAFIAGAEYADDNPQPLLSEDVINSIFTEYGKWSCEQLNCDTNEKCSFYEWYLKHREL